MHAYLLAFIVSSAIERNPALQTWLLDLYDLHRLVFFMFYDSSVTSGIQHSWQLCSLRYALLCRIALLFSTATIINVITQKQFNRHFELHSRVTTVT